MGLSYDDVIIAVVAVAVVGGLDVTSIDAVAAVVGGPDVTIGGAVAVATDGLDVIIAAAVLAAVGGPEDTAIVDAAPSTPAPYSCCLLRRNSK